MQKTLLLYIGLGILLTSCEPVEAHYKKEAPDDLISEETMTQMLIDVHIIEGARSGTRILGDTVPAKDYYDALYAKYEVTKAQYDTNFKYYSHFPTIMTDMYDVVIDSLNLREIHIGEQLRQYQSPNWEEDLADTTQQ